MTLEYTYLSLLMFMITIIVDQYVLRTRLLQQRMYWVYLFFISIFFFATNQYLTCRPIVLYSELSQLGVRIGCIPFEDFIFNFSLVTMPIILWQKLGRRV